MLKHDAWALAQTSPSCWSRPDLKRFLISENGPFYKGRTLEYINTQRDQPYCAKHLTDDTRKRNLTRCKANQLMRIAFYHESQRPNTCDVINLNTKTLDTQPYRMDACESKQKKHRRSLCRKQILIKPALIGEDKKNT